tara:strand:- start:559 stop:1026 length:468 start_codon:yes stop_codon:yes gene_type:complete
MKKINNKNFKKALSKFSTGVTIISINYNNNFLGKTVNSFASLSLKPPLVLFSLDKKSTSLKKYMESNNIGISILAKNQKRLSKIFANKNKNWNLAKYFLSKNNIPMIEKSLVNLLCKKNKTLANGDHIIFICEVKEVLINERLKPLIYVNNKYIK